MSMYRQKQQKNTAGFSLVEVLVSLSLFTVVVTISVGTLVVMLDANAKAREKKELLTQLSFTLDAMTRDIRTGFDYQCANTSSGLTLDTNSVSVSDCATGESFFAFTESGGSLTDGPAFSSNRIGYRLGSGVNANRIERNLGDDGWRPVTPDEIVIDDLTFYVTGTLRDGSDFFPPGVTIVIDGSLASDVGDDNEFTLQTTVVQRLLDI